VREKFTCRDREKISQAPAPFHVIARGWAGAGVLAMCLPPPRFHSTHTQKALQSLMKVDGRTLRNWLLTPKRGLGITPQQFYV
jgi:hypothetical protein